MTDIRHGLPVPRVANAELQRFLELVFTRLAGADDEIRQIANEVRGVAGTLDGMTRETDEGDDIPILDTPPTPTNLAVGCGIGICIVSWVNPFRLYRNHALTRVYRNTVDQFDTAAEIGTAEWLLYTDEDVEDETDYWYWVRFESTTQILGPPSDSVMGRTAPDPEAVYEAMRQDIISSPLAAALTSDIETPAVITEEIRRITATLTLLVADATGVLGGDVQELRTQLESVTGSDRRLGPAPNIFTGEDRPGAETARDTHAGDNAAWLALYDSNPNHAIELRWT